jgi:hypothetical protein
MKVQLPPHMPVFVHLIAIFFPVFVHLYMNVLTLIVVFLTRVTICTPIFTTQNTYYFEKYFFYFFFLITIKQKYLLLLAIDSFIMTVAGAENIKKIYVRYLNRLMVAWKGSYAVNFNCQYEDAELLKITPDDVASFLKVLAYGMAQPGPTDFPTLCRSLNFLNQAKKAISYFMPHCDSPWNVQGKCGNPTRSKVDNDVVI